MKKITLLFIFILISTVLISCGDDNPAGGNQTTLLPMKSGTYWVYMNYTLDSNNNRIGNYKTYDSIYVAGNITKNDTSGSIFINYHIDSLGSITSDTVYYSVSNLKVFAYTNLIEYMLKDIPFASNITYTQHWMKLVDAEDEDWKVFDGIIPETSVIIGTIEGNLSAFGSNSGNETITAESKSYNTRKFTVRTIFTGNFKYQSYKIPITLERKTYLYFADNVGLVKTLTEAMKIEISPLQPWSFPGQEQILLRHHIAN